MSYITRGAAPMLVAGWLGSALRHRFHNHTPQQSAARLAFQEQAADELRGNHLGRASEEGLGEVLGGRGGYGSGFTRHDAI